MYAIVEIAGQQFKVEGGKNIFVHRLEAEVGAEVKFEQVLLIEDEGNITIGEPTVKDAFVTGKILDNVRGDKVIVFKKKRKKGYRIKNGHRQNFSHIEILSINGKGVAEKPKAGKTAVKVSEETVAEETAAPKKRVSKKAATPSEEAPSTKAAAKKPASKKASKTKE